MERIAVWNWFRLWFGSAETIEDNRFTLKKGGRSLIGLAPIMLIAVKDLGKGYVAFNSKAHPAGVPHGGAKTERRLSDTMEVRAKSDFSVPDPTNRNVAWLPSNNT